MAVVKIEDLKQKREGPLGIPFPFKEAVFNLLKGKPKPKRAVLEI